MRSTTEEWNNSSGACHRIKEGGLETQWTNDSECNLVGLQVNLDENNTQGENDPLGKLAGKLSKNYQ